MTNERVSTQTIIDTLHTQASRVRTDEQRSQLYRLGVELANRIKQENPTFNQDEFLKACSIDTNWSKLQAAA